MAVYLRREQEFSELELSILSDRLSTLGFESSYENSYHIKGKDHLEVFDNYVQLCIDSRPATISRCQEVINIFREVLKPEKYYFDIPEDVYDLNHTPSGFH